MDLPETDSEDEMPPGWEERCTEDGMVFYAHHDSRSTQWAHPRTGKKKRVTNDLPYGWKRICTAEGNIIFQDVINNKSTYTDPRLAFAVEETKCFNELRQKFDGNSTAMQVLHGRDLTGCVAIVTGASSGIGFETARTLALHGCTVIFAGRNGISNQCKIAQICKEQSCDCINMHVDLSSLKSVKDFACKFITKFQRLDILVLNAGVFAMPFSLTDDGLEETFQVNFLSQFYLFILLQRTLATSKTSRVIFLSAESHRFSNLHNASDITEKKLSPSKASYVPEFSYNNSKLLCVLIAFEIQRRFAHLGIRCFSVHPGNAVSTSITRYSWFYRMLYGLVQPFTKSLQQAAAPVVYCAASPDLDNCGGIYVNNCVPCLPSKVACEPVMTNKTWVKSLSILENLLGKKAFSIV